MGEASIALSSRVRLVHGLVGQFPGLTVGTVIDLGGGTAKVRWTDNGPTKRHLDVHAWFKLADLELAE